MIEFIIGWLAPIVGEKWARPAAFGLLGLAVVLLLWGGTCAYNRHVINNYNQAQQNKQLKVEKKADQNLNNQKDIDNAVAAERQKEMDNATQNIPDQSPSARQRAIACTELRREAKQRREPVPAC